MTMGNSILSGDVIPKDLLVSAQVEVSSIPEAHFQGGSVLRYVNPNNMALPVISECIAFLLSSDFLGKISEAIGVSDVGQADCFLAKRLSGKTRAFRSATVSGGNRIHIYSCHLVVLGSGTIVYQAANKAGTVDLAPGSLAGVAISADVRSKIDVGADLFTLDMNLTAPKKYVDKGNPRAFLLSM